MKAFVTVTQQQFDISAEQGVPEDVLTQSVEFGKFIKGKDGSVIYNGSGVPSNTLGVNGDFYIDNVAPNNYYEKISGSWVLQGHFQGAQGEYTVITIGENGNWYIDGEDSGQRAIGIDGYTPIIGENNNWWINGVDTGKRAVGIDGVGISNWELVSIIGKVKTYRITFTDSTTFEYSITDGTDGNDGREVLIQNNGTYIQWQYEGDETWTNIVALTALKGDTGANIELNKSATHIQWRVVGDTNWIDLVALVDLKGADGKGIVSFDLFDVQDKTKIYRLLYTDATYVDIPIIDGNDGVDGLTPYIGINGNWWIGDVDQNIKAEGVDGVSPTIGLNGNWYLGAVDTGVKAQATGAYEIYHAGGGTLSEVDFNASITDIPAHIADATKHIDTTTAEFSGTIDETNDKFTIWDNSLLKWIRFSFTSLKTYLNGIYHKFGGSSFGAKQIIGSTDNQDFGIITNNTERLTVLKNGNVGIGTTVPVNKQHIVASSNGDGLLLERDSSTLDDNVGLLFKVAANDLNEYKKAGIFFSGIAASGRGNLIFAINNVADASNVTTADARMVITTAGSVCIGTVVPKSKLQVAGGIQCGDDTAAASADKVGTIRQRDVNNNTLLEFCKNTAGVYEWEKINDKLSLDQTTPQTIQGNVNVNGNVNAVTTNVNQSTLPSVNASQDAAILQDGSAFTGTDYVMPTNNVAVKFIASAAHTMGDFTVRVKSSATLTSTTATLTGYLYSDSAGSPSTLLVTGNVILHGSITTSYQELSLGTQYNLIAGSTYWLVIRWSSAPTGGNIILDSNTDINGGATSSDAVSWTLTNVRLRYKLRGRTFYGINAFSTNNFGVYGVSTNNFGVYGVSTNNYGVRGDSTNGIGVRGVSTNGYGIYGVSTNNYGIYGVSTNNYGVRGVSTNGIGVRGDSTNSYGIYGESTNNYGVYGYSTNNRAGYFRRNTATPTNAVPVVEILQDHASDPNSVLDVKQDGTGEIARFFDSGNEVASIEKGGLGVYKKGVVIGDNTDVASYENRGATRYRATANASYVEMCMQVSENSYSWITIVTNTW